MERADDLRDDVLAAAAALPDQALERQKLATAHFWFATVRDPSYVLAIYTAGLTQGLMWRAFDETGRLQYPDFVETVVVLLPMYWVARARWTALHRGRGMAAVNYFMTWKSRPAVYTEAVQRAARLPQVSTEEPDAKSRLVRSPRSGTRVMSGCRECGTAAGNACPFGSRCGWCSPWRPHRSLKSCPTFLIRSNIPTIASVQPYTPLELAGRDVYIAEGCYNCHSQMIRPIWAETKRYGEYSKPGEFVYDHPFQWGSRRIGPDLAREGGKQSHDWQVRHLEDPQQLVAQSIMPAFAHLLKDPLDFDAIQSKVDAMAMLGVPYGDAVKNGKAIELARRQAKAIGEDLVKQGGYQGMDDKKVIALVAYLQRIGTDIYAPAPAAPTPTNPAPAAAPVATR